MNLIAGLNYYSRLIAALVSRLGPFFWAAFFVAAVDAAGRVTQVAEKEPISNEATVGIYNFTRGADYVRAAKQMIANDERVNGEFYVAPVYNQFIQAGANIGICNIGDDAGKGMFGIGTPEDLDLFIHNPTVQSWFK